MREANESGKARTLLILAGFGLAVLAALVLFLLRKEDDVKHRTTVATYETTAADHMRKLSAAQSIHLDAFGEYGTFDQLIDAGILLNEKFRGQTPVVDGYVYRLQIRPREGERAPFYSINADPQEGSPTGELHFYIDSNVIGLRQSRGRPANATDRPRE